MVAPEKSIWFGCMLAASLFVLVLAGCGDVSESGSSQRAQPSKKSPPTETAESHAAGVSPPTANPRSPTCSDLSTSQARLCERASAAGMYSPETVLAAEECKPIPKARIEFWLANPRGDYDDAHRATVFAGQRGEYRLESNVPVSYGGRPPHIHVRVRAPGYEELITQHYPERGQRKANFDLVLVAE